jgi:hypothetical protein
MVVVMAGSAASAGFDGRHVTSLLWLCTALPLQNDALLANMFTRRQLGSAAVSRVWWGWQLLVGGARAATQYRHNSSRAAAAAVTVFAEACSRHVQCLWHC